MVTLSTGAGRAAVRLRVTGLVQGVGFRPFVYRLAVRHGLDGWVRNTTGEVQIALEGAGLELDAFLQELRIEAPPLARIEAIDLLPEPPSGFGGFAILPSEASPLTGLVSPDVGICEACLEELFDPSDRRYRYPFITCTECGPRYTIIEALPYDRERTSMAAFPPCPACLAEYQDPASRRYRSESNSCPECGPRIWYQADGRTGGPADKSGGPADGRNGGMEEALTEAVGLLDRGGDPRGARVRRVPPRH